MSIQTGIESLKAIGLNIFLSTKISDMPENYFNFSNEQNNKYLCLIGNGGGKLWKNIPDLSIENPIDTFTIDQMNKFAKQNLSDEIEIIFPNDKYILPLQKIARFLNFSNQSPIGIDISNEFGLWFAFRGAFLTSCHLLHHSFTPSPSPCETCLEKPCLREKSSFNARLMCPYKSEYQYSIEQLTYHQNIKNNLKNI